MGNLIPLWNLIDPKKVWKKDKITTGITGLYFLRVLIEESVCYLDVESK